VAGLQDFAMNSALALKILISELRRLGRLPREIQISRVGDRYWCSVFDTSGPETIANSVCSGHGATKELALLKALVERIERMAFVEGARKGHFACQTDRSDGFAAFPTGDFAATVARSHALEEATERFAWASWWDNSNFGHRILSLDEYKLSHTAWRSIRTILSLIESTHLLIVEPHLASTDLKVVILIAQTSSGGVITAGACGPAMSPEKTVLRASDELLRHGLALGRMRKNGTVPRSHYEAKILYFGLGHGSSLVQARIGATGDDPLQLPPLAIDTVVPHSMDGLVHVHRCLYEEQPPFVSGPIERLCI
jgi:ribosomal protein S12 methylthiotransferase accessory factor YcaO